MINVHYATSAIDNVNRSLFHGMNSSLMNNYLTWLLLDCDGENCCWFEPPPCPTLALPPVD